MRNHKIGSSQKRAVTPNKPTKQTTAFIVDSSVFMENPAIVKPLSKGNHVFVLDCILEELDSNTRKTAKNEKIQAAKAAINSLYSLMIKSKSGGERFFITNKGDHEDEGKIYLFPTEKIISNIPKGLEIRKVDNALIGLAKYLKDKYKKVIIVTNDKNLSLKACAHNIKYESLDSSQSIIDSEEKYSGIKYYCPPIPLMKTLKNSSNSGETFIEGDIIRKHVDVNGILPNQGCVFKNDQEYFVMIYKRVKDRFVFVEKPKPYIILNEELAYLLEKKVKQKIDWISAQDVSSLTNGIVEIDRLLPNETYIFKDDWRYYSALYNAKEERFYIEKNEADQKMIFVEKNIHNLPLKMANCEQVIALALLLDPDVKFVTISGLTGSGKSLVGAFGAISQIETEHRNILLLRPTVEVGNDHLGYNPGELEKKYGHHITSIVEMLKYVIAQYYQENGTKLQPKIEDIFTHTDNDELDRVRTNKKKKKTKKGKGRDETKQLRAKNNDKLDELIGKGIITFKPVNYLRGANHRNCVVIVEEPQNLTIPVAEAVFTRMVEGSKIVFIGDIEQIDSPSINSTNNGFAYFIELFTGQNCYGHIRLVEAMRGELLQTFLNLKRAKQNIN